MRWGIEGRRTRWYESLTLVRQQQRGEWGETLERVANAIRARREIVESVQASAQPEPLDREVLRHGLCRYGQMAWPANDHYIGRALELYGEYSESEVDLLRQVLRPGDVVVDAGANVGALSAAMAAAVGPTGRVYAFEPQALYYACLAGNVPENVTPSRAALGSADREIVMRSVEQERVHAPGWESTGPEFPVEQRTIDSLALPACALLKIDVDGPEQEILCGAEETIDRCRPLIYIEYDKPDKYPQLLEWLLARDYRLYQHMAPLYNSENFRWNRINVFANIVSAMVLAVPNERKDLRFSNLPRIRAEKDE